VNSQSGKSLTTSNKCTRNAMEIKFSEDLRPQLASHHGLQIQGRYMPEQEILDTYLQGAYGNAYDFDQKDKLSVDF